MADVTLERVSKRYGPVVAVDDVSLRIAHGELMVLVGPSGCGKSTLLRMIAGLEAISDGTVAIGGRVVNEVPPKDREVAMVFQSYALYPHMTVRQNLEYALRIRRTPAAERARRVTETAAALELDALLDRYPKQLSGGQRQRVAVGRAMVREPLVFLFDEPLSNLDAKLRVQMRAELAKLHRRLDATMVYVTHDQVEAMTLGDRIAVLNAGRLQQVGAPLELYERPQNAFVAGFVGTPPMNLLAATVGGGGETLEGAGFSLPLPPAWRGGGAVAPGRPLLVGIRPEHLLLAGKQPEGPSAAIDVELEVVETLGHQSLAHARLGPAPLVAILEPGVPARAGDPLRLQVPLAALHLFDAESSDRLAA
jgi:multiple sugar transport system ATP-binding protein